MENRIPSIKAGVPVNTLGVKLQLLARATNPHTRCLFFPSLVLAILLLCSCAPNTADATQDNDLGLLIFNHEIAIGMTFSNVQASFGSPVSVKRSFYDGAVIERCCYSNGWLVMFENGRVRSFHQFFSVTPKDETHRDIINSAIEVNRVTRDNIASVMEGV